MDVGMAPLVPVPAAKYRGQKIADLNIFRACKQRVLSRAIEFAEIDSRAVSSGAGLPFTVARAGVTVASTRMFLICMGIIDVLYIFRTQASHRGCGTRKRLTGSG